MLASAAGMDKEFTKKLLAADGLPVGDHVVLRPGTATLTEAERERLGLPVFVKPARAGSSLGITRVTAWDDLDAAIATARQHDPKVLVEAAIVGREIECAVLERPDGTVVSSLPAEIRIVGEAAFYDFDAKYLDDVCEFDVPAKLDDDVAEQLRDMAVAAFRALDGQGLARVDFFVGPDGDDHGERDQHHARVHADLDVPAGVGGHRRRLPDACSPPWWRRPWRAAPASVSQSLAPR